MGYKRTTRSKVSAVALGPGDVEALALVATLIGCHPKASLATKLRAAVLWATGRFSADTVRDYSPRPTAVLPPEEPDATGRVIADYQAMEGPSLRFEEHDSARGEVTGTFAKSPLLPGA